MRFSNNSMPEFTDQEAVTVYLYAVSEENKRLIKDIYTYTDKYLRCYFPKLPSYQAFNSRLNRLFPVLQGLLEEILRHHLPLDCSPTESLVDSLPIITYRGPAHGKVAPELTAKGYCSTKDLYYYGLKLHALGWRRAGKLPWLQTFVLSTAGENDFSVFKENFSQVDHRTFYGDKVYYHKEWFTDFYAQCHSEMLTPVKAVKGKAEALKQRDKAANALYSRAVSSIRQPIEAFFSWLIQKVDIQTASKVRSAKGLLLHVYGKLTAAFLYCIFNP